MAEIGVVVVTYNRIEKLKLALDYYSTQSFLPSYIIIVNNNSTDGTKEYLDDWQKVSADYEKYVISLRKNSGGSGGFYTGLEFAMKLSSEWIWVADDDAYPDKDALKYAEEFIKGKHNLINISAICGKVMNENGIDLFHRRRIQRGLFRINETIVGVEEYNKEYFKIDCLTYVGAILKKDSLEKVGLTNKELFIHYDDTDHSIRLSKDGDIVCNTNIKIYHDLGDSVCKGSNDWKTYYTARNKLIMYKNNFPRRYYIFLLLELKLKIIMRVLLMRNVKVNNVIEDAIKDASENRLGLREPYVPGWKFR